MSSAADAALAAALLLVDPCGLAGVRVAAQAGPVRDAWLGLIQAMQPLRKLPSNVSEDRLLGGIDLPATLAAGRPVLQPGLLAQADGAILCVPMAERLPAATATQLALALEQGGVQVQRDGLATHTAARFAVLALDEALPDDPALSPALADRLGLWIDLNGVSLGDSRAWADEDQAPTVLAARAMLDQVQVGDTLIEALCAAGLQLGVDSSRAAWFALRATRASAALFGRRVASADDAAVAARLVLAGRATRSAVAEEETAAAPEPPEPPEAQANADAADNEAAPEQQALQDSLVEAATTALPAGLLARLLAGDSAKSRAAASAGKAGALGASRQRGRPLGARPGAPHAGERLHLIATLRAAAPWQRLRAQTAPTPAAVHVRASDFHVRRFAQRRNTTTVFAVDASGSSALHRLAEAKGAVELMLAECYVRRDQVAVLAFRGTRAELLLPPTRSLLRAKRALAGLPGGGGTPLAAGIEAAALLVQQVRRSGASPVVVLLTDGRANVGRNGEGGRAQAQQDALAAARLLRAQGAQTLLVDTAVRPEPAAAALALAMGARYLALPQADAKSLARAVSQAAKANV
jgi:magnesium chelatase subunit D